jgi:hypothetical protein
MKWRVSRFQKSACTNESPGYGFAQGSVLSGADQAYNKKRHFLYILKISSFAVLMNNSKMYTYTFISEWRYWCKSQDPDKR